jgi:hypothetical protein
MENTCCTGEEDKKGEEREKRTRKVGKETRSG